ncbi:SWI/SNF chromatin-remodeling complex subunit, partial [Nowakowskiella sp. JEL0078]
MSSNNTLETIEFSNIPDLNNRALSMYLSRENYYKEALTVQNSWSSAFSSEKKRKAEKELILHKNHILFVRKSTETHLDRLKKAKQHPADPLLVYSDDIRRGKNGQNFTFNEASKFADSDEKLVPIRLDLEIDGHKVRDNFLWNSNEMNIKPEDFAQILCEDMKITGLAFQELKIAIAQSIREQIDDYNSHAASALEIPSHILAQGFEENDNKIRDGSELRISIKIDILLKNVHFLDQFEWDINCHRNSPELFAEEIVNELSLDPEFKSMISHSIREQIFIYSKSLVLIEHNFENSDVDDEELNSAFLQAVVSENVIRDPNTSIYFAPFVQELLDEEVNNVEKDRDRDIRRKRRQTHRSKRSVTLPDREPIKSMRTSLSVPIQNNISDDIINSIRKTDNYLGYSAPRTRKTAVANVDTVIAIPKQVETTATFK